MILGPIAEALAELFINAQLRKRKVLNRAFWIAWTVIVAAVILLGLAYAE